MEGTSQKGTAKPSVMETLRPWTPNKEWYIDIIMNSNLVWIYSTAPSSAVVVHLEWSDNGSLYESLSAIQICKVLCVIPRRKDLLGRPLIIISVYSYVSLFRNMMVLPSINIHSAMFPLTERSQCYNQLARWVHGIVRRTWWMRTSLPCTA